MANGGDRPRINPPRLPPVPIAPPQIDPSRDFPVEGAGLPAPAFPPVSTPPIAPPVRPPGVVVPFPVKVPPVPVEVASRSILARILLGGTVGFGIGAVITGVFEASRRELERERKRREEIEAASIEEVLRRQSERVARDRRVKTQEQAAISRRELEEITLPRPEIPTAPTQVPRPVFEPVPVELPAPTVPLPSPQPVPIEIPAPSPLPAPSPAPAPASRPRPAPVSVPSPLPGGLPGTLPGIFPGRLPAFFPLPRIAPRPVRVPRIGDFLPEAIPPELVQPLTPVGIATVPFPGAQPQPQQQPDRRCKEVKRRRRRKGKCREGFFREFPNKTRFVEWREVDCVTRRETQRSKLRREGFDIRNIEFPSFGI